MSARCIYNMSSLEKLSLNPFGYLANNSSLQMIIPQKQRTILQAQCSYIFHALHQTS